MKKRSSTLQKSLLVLEAIIDQPQSVGLPDLANRLGMSRSSMHRVLTQLQEEGLVVKVPNRDRFAIGARFSKLALNAMISSNKGFPIRAVIQKVVEEIEETVNLGVLSGRDFVYLERVECNRSPRIYLETGSRLPAHVTSGGKACMAFLETSARKRLVETMTLEPFTQHTITDKVKLLTELNTIRKRGYATANQEYADGITGVGVPVIGTDGHAVAALAMHAPVARLHVRDAKRVVEPLQATAARLAEIWH